MLGMKRSTVRACAGSVSMRNHPPKTRRLLINTPRRRVRTLISQLKAALDGAMKPFREKVADHEKLTTTEKQRVMRINKAGRLERLEKYLEGVQITK